MSFVGGQLKLKGGQGLPVKGGVKKKKKAKKAADELALVAAEGSGQAAAEAEGGQPSGVTKVRQGRARAACLRRAGGLATRVFLPASMHDRR